MTPSRRVTVEHLLHSLLAGALLVVVEALVREVLQRLWPMPAATTTTP